MHWCLLNNKTNKFSLFPLFYTFSDQLDDPAEYNKCCCICLIYLPFGFYSDLLTICPRYTCYNINKLYEICNARDKQPIDKQPIDKQPDIIVYTPHSNFENLWR